jgi:hypothetical protein
MTVDIWIRDYNPPRCFQKKISGRGKPNVGNSKDHQYLRPAVYRQLQCFDDDPIFFQGTLTYGVIGDWPANVFFKSTTKDPMSISVAADLKTSPLTNFLVSKCSLKFQHLTFTWV